MDPIELRTLKLLEVLEEDDTASQRDISKKLNISLGLANSFLKRLVQKGYFKVTTIPRKRIKYILTPEGALEKIRLTYQYFQFSFNFYRDARKKLSLMLNQFANQNNRRIVFWGVSEIAEIAYLSLSEIDDLSLIAIIDENNMGKLFFNKVVVGEDGIHKFQYDKIVVTTLEKPIIAMEKMIQLGVSHDKIALLEPDFAK